MNFIAIYLRTDFTKVNIQFIISAMVASLTVGGKALGKKKAINSCNDIMYFVGSIVHLVAPIKPKNAVDKREKENI